MSFDIDMRDPKSQRILAVCMVVVVVLYGFYHFMVKPAQAELKRVKAETITLQSQLNAARSTLQTRKKLLADKESLEQKLAELREFLPDHENVAVLLDQFSMVENATKVYVVGFKASETVDESGQPYQANKYKVTVEAGYHQFVEFMGGMMALPRIMSFSDMKIALNPGAPNSRDVNEGLEDQPRSLSIECSITSYIFKDLEEKKADTKDKKI
jgi:type IV pilus assembly protein PilO